MHKLYSGNNLTKRGSFILLLFILIYIGVMAGVIWLRGIDSTVNSQVNVQYRIGSSTLPAEQSWQFAIDSDVIEQAISSPIFVQSTTSVYIATSSSIYAFDTFRGYRLWQLQREDISSITVAQGTDYVTLIIVSQAGKSIEAIDAISTHRRWQITTVEAVQSRNAEIINIVVEQDQAYVSLFLSRGTKVLALNISDGRAIWDKPQKVLGDIPEAIHVYGDTLVVQTGELWYLNRTTGEIEGSNPLPNVGEISYGNSALYFVTDKDELRVVDPITLVENWRFDAPCTDVSYEQLLKLQSMSTLIHVRCNDGDSIEDTLVNVDKSGNVIWQFTPSQLIASLAVDGNYGYFLEADMSVHTFNMLTGEESEVLILQPAQWPGWGARPNISSDGNWLLLNAGNGQFFGSEKTK